MTAMEAARTALKEVFGYDDFRTGQEDAVAAILRRKRGHGGDADRRGKPFAIRFLRWFCRVLRWSFRRLFR